MTTERSGCTKVLEQSGCRREDELAGLAPRLGQYQRPADHFTEACSLRNEQLARVNAARTAMASENRGTIFHILTIR